MKGLLYKNLVLSKTNLIFTLCVQLIASAAIIICAGIKSIESTSVIMISMLCFYLILFLDSMLSSSFFAFDEKKGWISFAAASPSGMDGQVRSKYYFILIKIAAVLFIGIIPDCISCVIRGENITVLSMNTLICAVFIIMNAIQIPFIIRFGSDAGQTVQIAAIAAVLALAGVYLLFGDLSFLNSDDPIGELLKFMTNGGVVLIIDIIEYSALPLFYLSYRISVKLYRKGTENYE